MEVGQQVTELGEPGRAMSTPRDVPIRSSAPPQSTRTFDGSHQSSIASAAHDAPRPAGSEVWAGAISRLQTQVSLNTSLLDSHRQKVQDIEVAITRLDQAVGNAMAALHDIRTEIRSRPSIESSHRGAHHDPEDLQVLAEQVGNISNRVNEVDALRMQVKLLDNRMKRYEEHGLPAVAGSRSTSAAANREPSFRDAPIPASANTVSQPPTLPSSHQPLPPMRTSAHMSPIDARAMPPAADLRQHSVGSSATMQASSAGGFRLGEPLPPPSALTGWRTNEPLPPTSAVPAPPASGPLRPPTMQSEAQASGWAAVNSAQTAKRPFEEPRQSSYESSMTGSPKRPRLAPIMPRGTYSDDSSYVPSSVPKSSTVDSYRTHSRAPSDSSQSQSQTLPTPASAHLPGHRFIISTQNADSQESWRPESERVSHPHHPHTHHGPPGHGRRGGRGMRARGRGGRGGRGGAHAPDSHDLATPEWDRADWTGSQISSNGYYHAMHHQPHSPEQATRGGIVRRSGGAVGGPSDREAEFPATPLAVQGPYDPFNASHPDAAGGQQTSGGKKTRTKPIRNAEGVLIRKDGRPDMRSVSSANNLRKVHAKKEAERAEVEGRTPTSARSLAPAGSASDDEPGSRSGSPETPAPGGDEETGATDTQERHRELMNRIFPSGVEGSSRSAAERFFPTHDHHDVEETDMKTEPESEDQAHAPSIDRAGSHMTDVVMREMSEAQTRDHEGKADHEDTRMSTVEEERSEEKEPSRVEA